MPRSVDSSLERFLLAGSVIISISPIGKLALCSIQVILTEYSSMIHT